jgi:hypothetical protein
MSDFEGERLIVREKYINQCAVLGELVLHFFKQDKVKGIVGTVDELGKEWKDLTKLIDAIAQFKPVNNNPDVRDPIESFDVSDPPVETQAISDEDLDSDKELIMRIETMISEYNNKWNSMGSYLGINWRSGLNKHLIKMILEEINDN